MKNNQLPMEFKTLRTAEKYAMRALFAEQMLSTVIVKTAKGYRVEEAKPLQK